MQLSAGSASFPLKSRLATVSFRESASTIKIPASILNFTTRAVSTSMGEVAEGDATWNDDVPAGRLDVPLCLPLTLVDFFLVVSS